MTTDISVDKYIDNHYSNKKAVTGVECNLDQDNDYQLECKITLGNFDMSFDSYIDNHYGTDLAVSTVKCDPTNNTTNYTECDLSLGPLYTTEKVTKYVSSILPGINRESQSYDQKVQNNDISIDKYIDTFTSKSVTGISCSGPSNQLKCSVDLGEFDVNIDKYIDTLTDKAITGIQCSPDKIDSIDTTEKLQELTCTVTIGEWI